jgi:two-component system, OmpR family, KDP operon response regulator KdpE
MVKTRVLVVDDEISIIKLLRATLEAKEYEVLTAMNGDEALKVLETESPDLMLLDIMMPKLDGFEVCRRIREWSQFPIIMLSALNDENDKVKCLNLGADDYITKPFGKAELLARVKAVIRRTGPTAIEPGRASFSSGNLKINFASRHVTVDGEEVKLTPTEYNLLQELAFNAGKVLTYTHLLNKIWGPEYGEEREYLHVFAGRLRAKIGLASENTEYIMTVPGVGYQFKSVQ